MNRRGFLGLLPVLASGCGHARASEPITLRPPGARPPGEFERRCIRCFRCGEVCLPRAIRFDGDETPSLQVRERACTLCMRCTQACPTGALEPLSADPAAVLKQVKMGHPELNRRACLTWSGKGLCRLCYYVCPYADRAIDLSGPRQGPRFNPSFCVGCGQCEEACPTTARAIRILPGATPA